LGIWELSLMKILLPLPLPSQQRSFPRRCFSSGASPLLNSSKSTANAAVNKKTTPLPTKGPMSALRYKTGKTSKRKGGPGLDAWSVVGYSTAEAIDLIGLQHDLCTSIEDRQQIFTQVPITGEREPDCIYLTKTFVADDQDQSGDIFVFRTGSIVFWNFPELERLSALNILKPYFEEPYSREVVEEESEFLSFSISNTGKSHLERGIINVGEESSALVKYTFSDAISTSVKLGIWELSLMKIIDSIEPISEDLKERRGVQIKEEEALQKTGEILALRHLVNLSSDLLDTPDFYWDRESLEDLYTKTCTHLAVSKRTRVVNEKLTHCLEIMEMIRGHIDTGHGHKLERIIIYLIAIEIFFECLHFYERKYGGLSFLEPRDPNHTQEVAELLAEGAPPYS